MEDKAQELYARMGAVPAINAVGHMTMLGGSSPDPEVLEAMRLAGRYYVDVDALLQSTGRIIAGLLGCPAALVTPGCASALLLGTAACVSGADPEKMARLPDATGLKNEVVIQKAQRYKYDRVVRMAGVRLVEAGTEKGTTARQLQQAIGPRTAAVLYPAIDSPGEILPVQQVIDLAHSHQVPVIVDAAWRVYPLEGLKQYSAWGADLVGYGAKYFGALNSTGLLCGRSDLVEAARLHGFASFEKNNLRGIGRPLKVDRQEIVAVVVALRRWLEMDHPARLEAAHRRVQNLRRGLGKLPHVELSSEDDQATSLTLKLDQAALGKTAAQVSQALRQGNPAIWVYEEDGQLHANLLTVHDGDEQVMAARLREVLGS